MRQAPDWHFVSEVRSIHSRIHGCETFVQKGRVFLFLSLHHQNSRRCAAQLRLRRRCRQCGRSPRPLTHRPHNGRRSAPHRSLCVSWCGEPSRSNTNVHHTRHATDAPNRGSNQEEKQTRSAAVSDDVSRAGRHTRITKEQSHCGTEPRTHACACRQRHPHLPRAVSQPTPVVTRPTRSLDDTPGARHTSSNDPR